MRMNRLVLPYTILALVGCTSTKSIMRSEMQLTGSPSQAKDGLTMTAKVLDLQAMAKDTRLTKALPIAGSDKEVPWTLLNPPTFEVRVLNQTGHAIRMRGAIFKLVDAAGNLYDAMPKDKAVANLMDSFSIAATKQGVSVTPAGQAMARSALQQVKFLDENSQLLPDIADTYLLAFDLPFEPSYEGMNGWLAGQAALQLKIYEVPTKTDEAGNITKRVAFEFPLTVKTFKDTYEIGLMDNKLVSSVEVKK